MDFISPYDIIEISPSIVPDRQALLDARKTLYARLELSGKTELEYKGRKYTRDGIEKLFEQYLADTHWKYYQIIEQDGRLKAFLQTSAYVDSFQATTVSHFTDAAFIAFVEKWYASSYQKYVLDLIDSGLSFKLMSFLAQTHPLSAERMSELQFAIFIKLQNMAMEIRNLAEDKVAMKAKGMNHLWQFYDLKRIECLNALPDFYQDLRDEYALALCHLFIVLNNEYKKQETCKVLIRNTRKLKITGHAQYEVKRLYDFIKDAGESDSGSGWGRLSWIGIAVVIAIIRLASNSCTDHRPTFDAKTITHQAIQETILREGEFMAQDMGDQGLVAVPTHEVDQNFMKVYDFYSVQTGIPDTSSKYHPIEKSMLGYFNKAIPGCKNFPKTGEHSFTIDNQTDNDYLVFLLKEVGGVDVKHIAPHFNYTCFMNGPTARVYIIGGGKIENDVISREPATKGKRLPFINCSDYSTAGFVLWDSFISYRFGPGPGVTKIMHKALDYNIVIMKGEGRSTKIENRVKLVEH